MRTTLNGLAEAMEKYKSRSLPGAIQTQTLGRRGKISPSVKAKVNQLIKAAVEVDPDLAENLQRLGGKLTPADRKVINALAQSAQNLSAKSGDAEWCAVGRVLRRLAGGWQTK